MPELPDISLYVDAIEQRISGITMQEIRLSSPFLLRTAVPDIKEAIGQPVQGVSRMGKRIVLELPKQRWLVLHLMIAGRLQWSEKIPATTRPSKNTLCTFVFSSGALTLTEAGSKKRASLHFVDGKTALDELNPDGLEVLQTDLSSFKGRLTLRNHTLKRALTSPRLFSGIGNAYSDEILHAACLSPVKQTQSMTDEEIETLFLACQRVLNDWIERCRDIAGDKFPKKVTAFRSGMSVHGRFKEPCPVCNTAIQRIRYVGRETNYCPRCQTGGKVLADRSLSRLLKADWPRTIEELENSG